MRILLFFDLPSITSEEQKAYRNFVKKIKREGFYMLQESVYVKMAINNQVSQGTIQRIKTFLPKSGDIMVLTVTERQFSSMELLIGERSSDVITSTERIIKL